MRKFCFRISSKSISITVLYIDSIRYKHVRKHQSPDMPCRTHIKCIFCWSFDRDRPTGRDHNSVTSEDRVSEGVKLT